MKKLATLMALTLISLNSFAHTVPDAQLDQYRHALGIALENSDLTCHTTMGSFNNYYYQIFSFATAIEVSDNGDQPVLKVTFINEDKTHKSVVDVTTSADGKSIIGLAATYSEKGYVNLGTLEQPNVIVDFVAKASQECLPPKR